MKRSLSLLSLILFALPGLAFADPSPASDTRVKVGQCSVDQDPWGHDADWILANLYEAPDGQGLVVDVIEATWDERNFEHDRPVAHWQNRRVSFVRNRFDCFDLVPQGSDRAMRLGFEHEQPWAISLRRTNWHELGPHISQRPNAFEAFAAWPGGQSLQCHIDETKLARASGLSRPCGEGIPESANPSIEAEPVTRQVPATEPFPVWPGPYPGAVQAAQ